MTSKEKQRGKYKYKYNRLYDLIYIYIKELNRNSNMYK